MASSFSGGSICHWGLCTEIQHADNLNSAGRLLMQENAARNCCQNALQAGEHSRSNKLMHLKSGMPVLVLMPAPVNTNTS
jgi:hypothetical protein